MTEDIEEERQSEVVDSAEVQAVGFSVVTGNAQEEGEATDSDVDVDVFEVEDIATPEGDVILAADRGFGGPWTALVMLPRETDEVLVSEEGTLRWSSNRENEAIVLCFSILLVKSLDHESDNFIIFCASHHSRLPRSRPNNDHLTVTAVLDALQSDRGWTLTGVLI